MRFARIRHAAFVRPIVSIGPNSVGWSSRPASRPIAQGPVANGLIPRRGRTDAKAETQPRLNVVPGTGSE